MIVHFANTHNMLRQIFTILFVLMIFYSNESSARDYYVAIQSSYPVKKVAAEICDDQIPECNIYLAFDDKNKNIIHARVSFSQGGAEFRFALNETEKLSANSQSYLYFPLGSNGIFDRNVSLYVPHPEMENDSGYSHLVQRIPGLKIADLKIFVKPAEASKDEESGSHKKPSF